MDSELLIALFVLWCATTSALVSFFRMWFSNGGESFHPHSVDVEHRHGLFLVVQSATHCKLDCPVKSISAFVAPRGSSSSKQFTVLSVMISVAGMLGSSRWYYVKDASFLEASLAFLGFAALLLVAAFELDVVPERFLEDKLLVTGWLIEKLKLDKLLPFELSPHSENFKNFIRNSPEIYHLYEEDLYLRQRAKSYQPWRYQALWPTVHMLGAVAYVVLLPTAIILNDMAEEKVGWITGSLFGLFCFLAYLTGNYVPVLTFLRGWIILWNPFLREPHFMLKLRRAVERYHDPNLHPLPLVFPKHATTSSGSVRKRRGYKAKPSPKLAVDPQEAAAADAVLDSVFLRFARQQPERYLKVVGHLLVMSELVALLTPSVAIGLQWVTALCDGPPLLSIIDLLFLGLGCLRAGGCPDNFQENYLAHCILKN